MTRVKGWNRSVFDGIASAHGEICSTIKEYEADSISYPSLLRKCEMIAFIHLARVIMYKPSRM